MERRGLSPYPSLLSVLAERLHLTKATVLLDVPQPALSHQIKQLEDELGTQTRTRLELAAWTKLAIPQLAVDYLRLSTVC